ncbi:hypothetical protein CB1_000602029 [Camelus ferus]|nr:hypothetical protein CB1_000602029 [Camelus ferus]
MEKPPEAGAPGEVSRHRSEEQLPATANVTEFPQSQVLCFHPKVNRTIKCKAHYSYVEKTYFLLRTVCPFPGGAFSSVLVNAFRMTVPYHRTCATFRVSGIKVKNNTRFSEVIALVMDIFTDVDIFKEIVEASTRGISVYILLDESNFNHFLSMTEKQGCQVQRLRRAPAQSFADRLAQRKTANLAERNSNVRRSFNGTDNHIRFLQQRMPTLEHTTKSFLRNWRIESYLNDHSEAAPEANGSALGDRFEGYEGPENVKASALYAHSRLRSSFVFKPTLPEQQEVSSCTTDSSNSTVVGSQGSDTPKEVPDTPTGAQHPPDKPALESTPKLAPQPEAPKMHALPVPESHPAGSDPAANGPTEPNSCLYTTLCVNKQTEDLKSQPNENLLKRRSFPFFDHSRANFDHGSSKHYVYSTLTRNRVRQPEKPKEELLKSSKSMHNVTQRVEEEDEEEVMERDPPSGANTKSVSIAALNDVNKEEPNKELTSRKEVKGSPSFLKKGSQKLRSLLSLAPEKKENLSKNKAPAFYRMCSSSDTLLSEVEENQKQKKSEPKMDVSPRRKRSSSSNSPGSIHKSKEDVAVRSSQGMHSPSDQSNKIIPSAGPVENKFSERAGDASAPRFNTEQIQYRDSKEMKAVVVPERKPAASPRPKPNDELLKSHSMDRRVYSRFEPFCKIESAIQPTSNMPKTGTPRPEVKPTAVPNSYGRSSPMLNYNTGVYHSYQPNENKFRGLMQKFGNFIHKNK